MSTQEQRKYVIGCGCYLQDDGYFCSRSCRLNALEENIICDDDIDYDVSNLKLKKESFDKLKSTKNEVIKKVIYTVTKEYFADGTYTKNTEIH